VIPGEHTVRSAGLLLSRRKNGFDPVHTAAPRARRSGRTQAGEQEAFVVRVAMRTGLWLALGMGLVACGSGSEEPSGEESTGGETSSYEGEIGSTDVTHGKEVFDSFCEDCHPGGEEDVGPSLIAEPHSAARMRQQIREGSGKMRPFSEKRLSGEDLEALLAHLQSIGAVQ